RGGPGRAGPAARRRGPTRVLGRQGTPGEWRPRRAAGQHRRGRRRARPARRAVARAQGHGPQDRGRLAGAAAAAGTDAGAPAAPASAGAAADADAGRGVGPDGQGEPEPGPLRDGPTTDAPGAGWRPHPPTGHHAAGATHPARPTPGRRCARPAQRRRTHPPLPKRLRCFGPERASYIGLLALVDGTEARYKGFISPSVKTEKTGHAGTRISPPPCGRIARGRGPGLLGTRCPPFLRRNGKGEPASTGRPSESRGVAKRNPWIKTTPGTSNPV